MVGITSFSKSCSNAAKAGAAAKTFPSARSFLCATVGHDHDHGHDFPFRQQVVKQQVRLGKPLPLRLVPADAVEQVQHWVLLLRGVTRRRVDLHFAGRAHRLGIVGDHLQPPVRYVLLRVDIGGRVWERGDVVDIQDYGLPLGPRGAADRLRVYEQQRGELVQATTPGEPFVRRAGRFIVDVLDPGFFQRLVKVLDALVHTLRLGGADAQPDEAALSC